MKTFKEFLNEAKKENAYSEGFKSGTRTYKDKVPVSNPYDKGTKEHKDWKEGFNDAYDQASK